MRTKRKVLKNLFCLSFLALSIGIGGLVSLKSNSIDGIVTNAATDIETSTGVTLSTNGTAGFTNVTDWRSKAIVFDIKTDGSATKLQLLGSSGSSGLIRTKPDRNVNTADLVAYENQSKSPYWASKCYSVSLGEDWYRWVVDLSDLKANDMSNVATGIRCFEGNNVQIKNLKFADEAYAESNSLCGSSYGFINTPIENWRSQKIKFDMRLPDDTQRRFVVCKDSGGNLSGFIVCTKTALKYQNPDGNDPYLLTYDTAPVSLGNDWYHFVFDLSKVQMPSNRTGTETIDRIKNLPDSKDGNPAIEIKNFKLDLPEYDPSDDADYVLESNKSTTIPDVTTWCGSTISFEVYHDSLDLTCDPQFIFGAKGTNANLSSYFGYKSIYGEEALYLRNVNGDDPYWTKATTQPEEISNGWYKWTIDLSELGKVETATGLETIGSIYNRGSKNVYIRNFSIDSVKNPADDADLILTSKEKTNLPTVIPYWQYSTVSFDIYHGTLDFECDPQFQFIVEGNNKAVTGYFGYKSIYGEEALYLRNTKPGAYWIKSSSQPVAVGGGWYNWTIDLSELGNGESCTGLETLATILNRGSNDIYIRNFTVISGSFVKVDKKDIIVPYEEGSTTKLNANIVEGTGELVYTSSNEEVATVSNTGEISFLSTGSCEITVSVKDKPEIKSATSSVKIVGLKNYSILNLDELTDGENSIEFPLITSVSDNVKTYSYNCVEENNPSVAIRFLLSATYLEQNRQAVTIWGPETDGLFDGNYGMWAACYNGALVFDIYGNNGVGGINVDGINTRALNSHNTLIQSMAVNTDYYVEAGAIDLAELIDETQYSYFYIKVNGVLVWSMLDVAKEEWRNPLVAFTAVGASRCKVKTVELVDVTLVTPDGQSVVQVANGLKLPEMKEPTVTDEEKKFIGWKTEDGSIWNYDSDIVDGAMTLTAEITSEFSTVTFDLNHDDLGVLTSKYVGNGMYIKTPYEDPVRDGYRFKYWSKSENGNEYDFYTPVNEDITLYANWVKVYKVSFVYDGKTYLSVSYDVNTNISDPGWGYKDKPDFGEWLNRNMFELNTIANGRAPYFSLTENGERVDFDNTDVTVTEDRIIYICFAEVETVKADEEEYDPKTSKWDYVSIRDLDDTQFKTDEYYVTKYDTSTATYTPSKNNTTDSVIFRGEINIGDKFENKNMNIANIAIRSNLSAYNSVNIWLRTKEVYLETKDNSKSVHLAFQSFENVPGLEQYLVEHNGVMYLKTNTYIPLEYGILAVTTPGFEDYDRVYLKLAGCTVFDVIIPKFGKSLEGATFRVGFVTDSDTATNAALSIKGVYPSFTVDFKDSNGQAIAESITLPKYSYIEKPDYQLPEVEGKLFAGWFDANTNQMWSFGNDRITSNVVLVPTYGYQVTIDPNDGAFADGKTDKQKYDPRVQLVGENCAIKFPTDPINVGNDDFIYKFAGWETDDGRIWDPENDVVTANITLKAKWEAYITVTYYVEDKDYKWESKTVKVGSVIGSPKYGDPDSYDAYDDDEHEFIGWYAYDKNGDYVEVNLATLVAEKNIDIFAIFDEEPDEPEQKGDGKEKQPTNNEDTKNGCASKKGCKGVAGGNLAILSILLAIGMKKKYFNKNK